MSEKEELSKLRGTHKVFMRRVGSLESEIKTFLQNFDIQNEEDIEKLYAHKTKFQNKIEEIKSLDNKIISFLSEDEYEHELNESLEREDKFIDISTKIDRLINKVCNLELKSSENNSDPGLNLAATRSPSQTTDSIKVRLPKLELKPFDGNILNWNPFWDRFYSSIDSNPNISRIDKFAYLQSFLLPSASECISGLTTTAENYSEAVEILKQRYGNTQVLINAHMKQFVSLPIVKSIHDIKGLRKLYEKIEGSVRNLKTLNVDQSSYGSLLVPLINEKIPNELRLIISRKFENEVWVLPEMLKVLKFEIEAKERTSVEHFQSENNVKQYHDKYSTSALLTSESSYSNKHCVFCNSFDHFSHRCRKMTNPLHKRNVLKKNGLCFICFQKGHLASNCTLKNYSCNKCKGKHNITICLDVKKGKNNESITFKNDNELVSTDETTNNFTKSEYNNVLLQTAKTYAQKLNNSASVNIRILFDSGSQRTYITEHLKESLDLKAFRTEKLNLKTFGSTESSVKIFEVVKVQLNGFTKNIIIDALVVPRICSPITNQSILSVSCNYPHLKNLKLADPLNYETANVDILIGTDYYHEFFTDEIKRGKPNEPVALSSHFGWVLSGNYKVDKRQSKNNTFSFFVGSNTLSEIDQIDVYGSNLKECFSNVYPPSVSNSEKEEVYEFYKKNLSFNGNNYSVKLPLKSNCDTLPDNYQLANLRLQGLQKRLNSDFELCKNYNQIIKDYLKENIIEEVNEEQNQENLHYLPHRAVVRNDKDTTKVRIVFDASAKSSNQPCLNDILYSGPCLLPLVQDILFRFRLGEVAVVADIQQAFLQIFIDETHRNYLRFLYFEDIFNSNKIKTFRFTRVMFGLTCSPFLLNATIKAHVEKFLTESTQPLLMKFLQDLYVDDTATSFDCSSEAKKFYHLSKSVLSKGGFNIRKWESNNAKLSEIFRNDSLHTVHTDESTFAQSQLGVSDKSFRKVLGTNWDTKVDSLVYDYSDITDFAKKTEITKRNVLRTSAMFYDPLGLTCPIILQFRLIFKSLCEEKLNWDSPVPLHYAVQWKKLIDDLQKAQEIYVPRYSFLNAVNERDVVELHGFCDSSSYAYSAVIYIREISKGKPIHTSLFAAKCRLAPSKSLTIPRLELLGCLLLSEQIKAIYNAISERISIHKIYCWSDSQISLWWIKQVHKSWKIWIQNRVDKIRSNVPIDSWRYIRTHHNPADIATRQLTPSVLPKTQLWWEGPSLLRKEECDWPEDVLVDSAKHVNSNLNCQDDLEERGSVVVMSACVESNLGVGRVIDIEKFSQLEKLLRVTSYVVRFKNNLLAALRKKDLVKEEISVEDLKGAEEVWIKYEQSFICSDKIKFNKLKHSLDLFYDENNFLRSKTRMDKHKNFSFSNKNPMLLRRSSYFTKLVILSSHIKVFHSGIEATLSNVRLEYWIPKGRQVVKNVLKSCFICKLVKGKFVTPVKTPSLPQYRVNCSVAFESVGLDFAGPLFVKDIYTKDATLHKSYILLFTCATTRAIHLEVTREISARAVILAIRRFVSRRGYPNLFISDNFKSFKSLDVKDYLRSNRIKWHFILEKSPWWGGFYERLISLVKSSLKKVVGKAKLDYGEVSTVVAEIEGCLNSRPLTYLNEENTFDLLTPNHLIYGRDINQSNKTLNNKPMEIDCDQMRSKALHCSNVINSFMNRFMKDYMLALQERHSYQRVKTVDKSPLKINGIVLIKDDNKPRLSWRKGKIEKLIAGEDNLIRGADIRVYQDKLDKTTVIRRPIQHLVPLEVTDIFNEPDENEPASKERPRRNAALNADLIRSLRS